MIKVFIVDDDILFRESLKLLLAQSDGFCFVGESAGTDAIQQVLNVKPDVVLMDVVMPDCDGIEIAAKLASVAPEIHVVILTSFVYPESLVRSVKAAAAGFIPKAATNCDILQTIRSVVARDLCYSPNIRQFMRDKLPIE